jgi:hypothetical protein
MGFHWILWRFHEDLVIYLGINSGPCMSHSGGWVKIEALLNWIVTLSTPWLKKSASFIL